MAHAISCPCGWEATGAEDEVIEAFVEHAEESHGKKVPSEAASAMIKQA